MATEIEHKYLVTDKSYRVKADKVIHIKQGYLSRDKNRTVRVRTTDNQAFITIKGAGNGISRPEYEFEIPYADGISLLDMCLPVIIEKTRHIVMDNGNKWEIDEYHGVHAGLVTAEIEIPNEEYTYPLPPFIGQDVTGNQKYSNAYLSQQQLSSD